MCVCVNKMLSIRLLGIHIMSVRHTGIGKKYYNGFGIAHTFIFSTLVFCSCYSYKLFYVPEVNVRTK